MTEPTEGTTEPTEGTWMRGRAPAALALALAAGAGLHGGMAAQEPEESGYVSDPVGLTVAYTADLAVNAAGGRKRGVVGLGNLDAVLRVDAEALLGWEGTSAFVYGLANHGGEVTALTGDAQIASNIEAPSRARLYEGWIQKNFSGPSLSVLAGLYDVNSEFDVLGEAGVFLNSSFGIGAEFASSGLNGPSIFPVTTLGIRVQWHPSHRWYAQAALMDGVPGDPEDPLATAVHLSSREGALWVAEVGYLHHRDGEDERGEPELGRAHVHPGLAWRLSAGLWQYGRRETDLLRGTPIRSHPGVFLLAEGRSRQERDADQGVGIFARWGIADERTNRFRAYTGAGITYTGLIPGRDRDRAGVGIAAAHNGEPYRAALRIEGVPTSSSETTLELTYRAAIATWLIVQPDVQLVLDPGTDPRIPDSLLFAVRVGLRF